LFDETASVLTEPKQKDKLNVGNGFAKASVFPSKKTNSMLVADQD
jgi:hypothetical protein